MRSGVPLEFRVPSSDPKSLHDQLIFLLTSGPTDCLAAFDLLPPSRTEAEREFWMEERDHLTQLRPLGMDSVVSPAERSLRAVQSS